jgi:regulator of sirC expression with transglutaminase-like and TPR domain
MTRREILVRLQNNLKIRLLERGDELGALTMVEATRAIAPDETRLLLDAGVLYARAGQPARAKALLEAYLETLTVAGERAEIIALLRSLHDALN